MLDKWEDGFRYLREFADREGHTKVLGVYKMADGYRLGQWVAVQRTTKDIMLPERKVRLETLSGWSWDAWSDKWEDGFRCLKEFVEREGHAKIIGDYKMADGYRLGQWVSHQRSTKDGMSLERIVRLEALPGWVWDVLSEQWEDGFRYLQEFSDREGHTRVLRDYKSADGYQLAQWVTNQRARKDKLSLERKIRLEALPGWSWDILSEQWEDGFRCLTEFIDREGHAKVAQRYKTIDGYGLGSWVSVQRLSQTLSPDRKLRLEELPGWSWNPFSDKWDEGFFHLKKFAAHEGHSNVPTFFKTEDGYRLGQWVGVQRGKIDNMSSERQERLEALPGWSWNDLSTRWDEGFGYLHEFSGREGHAKVPSDYKSEDGYPLGQWVGVQRVTKDSMVQERKARLEALPGWNWSGDLFSDKWEAGFSYLNEFIATEGHAKVPNDFKMADGYRLGQWVGVQRGAKASMTQGYQMRLEALPSWSWDARTDNWEEAFRYLNEFANREGHAKVPTVYKNSDGYSLGQWVAVQRTTRDIISTERKARLEAMPGWVWRVKPT